MKRFYLIGLVLLVTFTACDNLLDDDDDGDDKGRREIVSTTVEGLADLKDDTHVKLTGTIKEYVWDERYLFEDSTGTVEVEIDFKVWRRNSLDPKVLPINVEIVGEMDKERGGWKEIDVDRLTKL